MEIRKNVLAKWPAGSHPGKNKTQRGNPRWENMPAGKSPATLVIPGRFLTSAIIVFIWLPGEKFFNLVRKSWNPSPVKISKSTGSLGRDVLILGIDTNIDRSTTTLGYVTLWLGGTHKGCQASSSKLDRTRREGGRSSEVVRSPNLKNYIWLCFHLFKSISMSLWSFWFYGQSTDN